MTAPTCTYCPRPPFAAAFTSLPLCEQHLELALITLRLKDLDIQPTTGAIQQYIRRLSNPRTITPQDIPDLLEQMEQ